MPDDPTTLTLVVSGDDGASSRSSGLIDRAPRIDRTSPRGSRSVTGSSPRARSLIGWVSPDSLMPDDPTAQKNRVGERRRLLAVLVSNGRTGFSGG